MADAYVPPSFAYQRAPDQDAATPAHHPVVIIGAGPVGLSMALDLRRHGIDALVLDDNNTVSNGSRAICFAKRTLEIFDKYGVAQRAVDKGITWNLGRVLLQSEQLYQFNLLPEDGHRRPAFINLQQYYLEQYLLDQLMAEGRQVRWLNKVTGVDSRADGATLTVETPDGPYQLTADWVIACDGARSPTRKMLGLTFDGQVFQDRFLIADVTMHIDYPTERWFWFDPPFNPGQSALLHRQPDGVWRIDLQLGWDADPEEEKKPENVIPRIKAVIGDDVPFDLGWVSIYTFQCRRLQRFVHDRVIFAGDSAHQVSPFGARGANSGIQDVDNLGWKLAAVLDGRAPAALIGTYHDERAFAADENILNSTRSTDFITPKSTVSRQFRDGVLQLARQAPFARAMVNSGRLSVPAVLDGSMLNTPDGPDAAHMPDRTRPGAALVDAPITADGQDGFLLDQVPPAFTLLHWGALPADLVLPDGVTALTVGPDRTTRLVDTAGAVAQRYGLRRAGDFVFVRPDAHVTARGHGATAARLTAARDRALGLALADPQSTASAPADTATGAAA